MCVSTLLFVYRCTPHSTTQIAPTIALNNRKLVTAKDRLNPNYCFPCSNDVTKKCISQFDIESSVLALNMRDGEKWLHATVANKIGVNIYNVHVHDLNVIWKRHANQLLGIPNESQPSADHQVTSSTVSPRPSSSRVRKRPDID